MKNNNFNNKKILFISLQFFNYEKIISEKIKELGGEVTYFDERPSNSVLVKAIIRLKRDFYQKKIDRYYRTILVKTKTTTFDYFFLIKGEVVPIFFLEELRKNNPKIIFVFYTFDSFENNPNSKKIITFFEKKYTFDSDDSENHEIEFRPLFFSDDYSKIYLNKAEKYKYDVMFVGTAHSDRYVISEFISDWCLKNYLKSFAFYYSPSRLAFVFMKFFDSTFKNFDLKKITFKSLTHAEIIKLYENSKIVLDINHPGQKGLTMRTFESLGAGKKIITTNQEIKKYSFYNTNNICIIERNNIQLDLNFFKTNFQEIDNNIYYKMSLDGWLEDLFFYNEADFWFN